MRPISEGLFILEKGEAALLAGRRRIDGAICFPCPKAHTDDYEEVVLPREGTLWSYTVQRFRPKPPYNDGRQDDDEFNPFAVGYVELPGTLIIESRLVVSDFSELRLGLPMRLVLEPLRRTPDGEFVTSYAFSPIADANLARPNQ